MLTIKLIRHGESEGNVKPGLAQERGDANLSLTAAGREQARTAGTFIGSDFLRQALIYASPYQRTRQTLDELLAGAGLPREAVRVFEDPRLREVEHGLDDVDAQEQDRKIHGRFYYRFSGGESPADCFDRTSSFLEGLMRQVERKSSERVLIVTHGLTIRCFVMRFFHLRVEEYEGLANPANCDIITIGAREEIGAPLFRSGKWAVTGLRLRPPGAK